MIRKPNDISIHENVIVVKIKSGETFLASIEDLELIKSRSWSLRGKSYPYICCSMNNKTMSLHRLLMGVTDNRILVDHINRNKLDNRRCNLRLCTATENARNSNISSVKTTAKKSKGVHFCKTRKKWNAYIRKDGSSKNLGRFNSEVEAAKAYNDAAKLIFGDFAVLNNLDHLE